jgi:hypothetical protein
MRTRARRDARSRTQAAERREEEPAPGLSLSPVHPPSSAARAARDNRHRPTPRRHSAQTPTTTSPQPVEIRAGELLREMAARKERHRGYGDQKNGVDQRAPATIAIGAGAPDRRRSSRACATRPIPIIAVGPRRVPYSAFQATPLPQSRRPAPAPGDHTGHVDRRFRKFPRVGRQVVGYPVGAAFGPRRPPPPPRGGAPASVPCDSYARLRPIPYRTPLVRYWCACQDGAEASASNARRVRDVRESRVGSACTE